jgi:pilus assembly protein Flp/PilA
MENFIAFFKEENGATAVEYAIMVSAIAAVIIAVVFVVGGKVESLFEETNTQFS